MDTGLQSNGEWHTMNPYKIRFPTMPKSIQSRCMSRLRLADLKPEIVNVRDSYTHVTVPMIDVHATPRQVMQAIDGISGVPASFVRKMTELCGGNIRLEE